MKLYEINRDIDLIREQINVLTTGHSITQGPFSKVFRDELQILEDELLELRLAKIKMITLHQLARAEKMKDQPK